MDTFLVWGNLNFSRPCFKNLRLLRKLHEAFRSLMPVSSFSPWTWTVYPLEKCIVIEMFSWFWFWISLRIIWWRHCSGYYYCITNYPQTSSLKPPFYFAQFCGLGVQEELGLGKSPLGSLTPLQSDGAGAPLSKGCTVLSQVHSCGGPLGAHRGSWQSPYTSMRDKVSQTSCLVDGFPHTECPKRTRPKPFQPNLGHHTALLLKDSVTS